MILDVVAGSDAEEVLRLEGEDEAGGYGVIVKLRLFHHILIRIL